MEPLKLNTVHKVIAHEQVSKESLIITEINILNTIQSLSFVMSYDFCSLIIENLQTLTEKEEDIRNEFRHE